MADLGIRHQALEQADERHGGGHGLASGAACRDRRTPHRRAAADGAAGHGSAREVAAEVAAALVQVLQLGGAGCERDVGRKVRVELAVAKRNLADGRGTPCRSSRVELLHLVGGVSTLEVWPEHPSLDGLGQDDGGLAPVPQGSVVGGVHLAAVVSAALETPDLGVGHGFDHSRGCEGRGRRSARARRRRTRT